MAITNYIYGVQCESIVRVVSSAPEKTMQDIRL